ncbi:hypothetical protein [Simkania sp.]|uniref:hypothetical protein n=1 Tax=Simkania sp. TaxID=34094 RepID=UPI003B5209C9
MSIDTDSTRLPPSQRFAQFVGEVTGYVGRIIGSLETYTVGKIEEAATDNPTLQSVVNKVKENSDKISQAFFIVGCIYNFYTSPFLFLTGVGLGALASAAPFPVHLESLQQGELLGRTSEDGYAASRVMFSLASINYYLGRTLLDDMSISIFSGLLAGNSFYHMFKESKAGQGVAFVGNQLARVTELALDKLPFYNLGVVV